MAAGTYSGGTTKPTKPKPNKPNKPNKPKPTPDKGPRRTQRSGAEDMSAAMMAAFQRYMQMFEGYQQQLLGGASVNDMMRRAQGLYPKVTAGPNYTRGQMRGFARQDVAAIMNPLLANIRETYGDRSKAMGEAYGYYYGQTGPQLAQYAQNLQGVQSQALASQGAADQALASYLQQAGGQVAADIGGQLQAINAPAGTLAESAGNLGGLAGGSAGQTYALGSAAMDQARAQAQSANTIAASLPISQQKYGAEQLLARQAQLNTQMGEDIGALEAKIPELTQSIYGQYRDERSQNAQLKAARANAMMGFLGDAYTQRFNRTTAGAALLRDLITATGGAWGDASSLAASLLTGGAGGFPPSQTDPTFGQTPGAAGGGLDAKDRAAILQQIRENLSYNDLFKATLRPDVDTPGFPTGPSRAKTHPYQAYKSIMGEIDSIYPGLAPKVKKQIARAALQAMGIPWRTKPWKPSGKPTNKPPGKGWPKAVDPETGEPYTPTSGTPA